MIIGYCNRRINKSPSISETFSSSLQILTRASEKKKKQEKKKEETQRIKFNSHFTSGKREIEALVIVVVATKTYTSTMFPSLLFKWMEKGVTGEHN